MLSSRKIDDLAPPARNRALKFLGECRAQGIDVLVTCTVRDEETQNELYSHGRTREQLDGAGLLHISPKPGPIVTNAKGGDSFHQYEVALDGVPLRYGKPVWGTEGEDGVLWNRVGEIGEACGLEWAGRWHGHLREMAHFQYTGGLTLADFKQGRRLLADAA